MKSLMVQALLAAPAGPSPTVLILETCVLGVFCSRVLPSKADQAVNGIEPNRNLQLLYLRHWGWLQGRCLHVN